MIFRVPEDYKGSFVLSSLQKTLSAKMTISITGNKLYAPDVKAAIKCGHLIPEKSYDEYSGISSDAMIVNKTDKVLVLGSIILKPWASLLVDKDVSDSAPVQSACSNGLVCVISDNLKMGEDIGKKGAEEVSKNEDKDTEETTHKSKPDIKVVDKNVKNNFIPGEDREPTAVVWDFRTQETKKAEKIPKTPDTIRVDEENVEKTNKTQDVTDSNKIKDESKEDKADLKGKNSDENKKRQTNTKVKEKSSSDKNKGKEIKKTKSKPILPVGEKRPVKTVADASIELDSRGNPLVEKPSEQLKHLIDDLTKSGDIDFIDL